jgi:hypothetical protein
MAAVLLAVGYVLFAGAILVRLWAGRGRRGGGGRPPKAPPGPPSPSDFDLWESELERTARV